MVTDLKPKPKPKKDVKPPGGATPSPSGFYADAGIRNIVTNNGKGLDTSYYGPGYNNFANDQGGAGAGPQVVQIGGLWYRDYGDGYAPEPLAKWEVDALGLGGGGGTSGGGGGGGGSSAAYEPAVGIASVEPAGYGYVKVTYTDGSQGLEVDRGQDADKAPAYYDPNVPKGYVPIRDAAGNVVDVQTDPTYTQDPVYYDPNRTPTGSQPVYDTKGHVISYADDPGYTNPWTVATDKRNFDYNAGRDVRGDFVSDRDYGLQLEDLAMAKTTLAHNIEQDKADLAYKYADLAASTGVARERISADIANTQAQIAQNERESARIDAREREIAAMQNKTQLRGQDISQRGQDIAYATDTRGQDITREANITGAAENYYGTVAALANNPVKQAMLVTGVDYGTTPGELAANDYRDYYRKLVGTQRFVGAAPPPMARVAAARGAVIHPDMIETGDGRVIRTRPMQRVLMDVGEQGPEQAQLHRNNQGEMVMDAVHPRVARVRQFARFGAAAGATTVSPNEAQAAKVMSNAGPFTRANATAWMRAAKLVGLDALANRIDQFMKGGTALTRVDMKPLADINTKYAGAPAAPAPAVPATPDVPGGRMFLGPGVGPDLPPPPPGWLPDTGVPNYTGRSIDRASLTQAYGLAPTADAGGASAYTKYSDDPLAGYSEQQLAAAKIRIKWDGTYDIKATSGYWVPATGYGLQEAMRRLQGQTPAGRAQPGGGTGTRPGGGAGAAQPGGDATPPGGTPGGGTGGGGGGTGDPYDAAKTVLKDVLIDIVNGKAEQDNYKLDPLFGTDAAGTGGVDIGRPQDYAYSYDFMGPARKKTLVDAFDSRDVPYETFDAQRRRYRPAALNSGQVIAYG